MGNFELEKFALRLRILMTMELKWLNITRKRLSFQTDKPTYMLRASTLTADALLEVKGDDCHPCYDD